MVLAKHPCSPILYWGVKVGLDGSVRTGQNIKRT
jgi:hypothetical protein